MMNTLLQLINAGACGVIALSLIWAVLNPKVHDGVVIKAGLICMALGFGSIALLLFEGVTTEGAISLERALMLINAGITIVILGYLRRKARVHHPVRRSTDWAQLMDTRPTDAAELHE